MKFERHPSDEKATPVLIPRKEVGWESGAVFNPGVIFDGEKGVFRMLYRTYTSKLESLGRQPTRPGQSLAHQISHIGYAESKDGVRFERRDAPFISPDQPFDSYSCEDPRITKIGDTYYVTYTAIDAPLDDPSKEPNIRIALATTKDFVAVKKHGIIGPPKTSKAAALFPDPVSGGKIGFIMTIASDSTQSHVAVRYYDSIEDVMSQTEDSWAEFLERSQESAVLKTEWWLHRGPELGAPPIRTDKGWLLVYSAESMSHSWTATAALLDLEEPHKLVARAPGFLLQPTTDYETDGLVPNVTFPSGAAVAGEDLCVYYGGADTVIGMAKCKIADLLAYLERFKDKE